MSFREIHPFKVIKTTGEREPFNEDKLEKSLLNAGADEKTSQDIINQIRKELKPITPTSKIYADALRMLSQKDRYVVARYSLKKAVRALGPTGFPFEKLVREVYNKKGYTAVTGIFVTGKCATHEVDVLGIKDGHAMAVEAKFHNQAGLKSDLKVALYVKARFEDIMGTVVNLPGANRSPITECHLITNTKFTETAIGYAQCANLSLIGWNYPDKGNLHDLIQEHRVHPVTCLRNLHESHAKKLVEQNIIFIRQILGNPDVLDQFNMGGTAKNSIIREIQGII